MYSEIVALNKLMMKLSESIIISSFENGNLHIVLKKRCIPAKFSLLHFVLCKMKIQKCSDKVCKGWTECTKDYLEYKCKQFKDLFSIDSEKNA